MKRLTEKEMTVPVTDFAIENSDDDDGDELNERLKCGDAETEEIDGDDDEMVGGGKRRRKWKRKTFEEFGRKLVCFITDMTISRSCRHSVSVSVMLWTSVFLLLLARGVYCSSEDQTRYIRYPRFEQDTEMQPYAPSSLAETFNVMHFLRELIQQKQQQRANQQLQMYTNGEDLSESQIDWRKVPLPLLYQIRAIINEGSKEEDKRGSYMSLCHFKICNLG